VLSPPTSLVQKGHLPRVGSSSRQNRKVFPTRICIGSMETLSPIIIEIGSNIYSHVNLNQNPLRLTEWNGSLEGSATSQPDGPINFNSAHCLNALYRMQAKLKGSFCTWQIRCSLQLERSVAPFDEYAGQKDDLIDDRRQG
jgi:hypothetical protein